MKTALFNFVLVLLFLVARNVTLLLFSKWWQIKPESVEIATSATGVSLHADHVWGGGGGTHLVANML